jgi:exopolyphosphatase / guanosine-5'-triphosphate,3'-diphosphate pyrophosphatase
MRRVAAVDCGTNTIRMVIADLDPATGEQHDLDRRSMIVRLGQGVDRTGELAPDALRRTLEVADEYAEAIDRSDVESVRVVGTSAARDARNGAEFRAAMRSRFGVPVEVVSGDEEAGLAYAGATRGIAGHPRAEPPVLVVDVGGGSTELVMDVDGTVTGQSVDIGSVRLTERFLGSDPPSADELEAAVHAVGTAIEAVSVPIDRAGSVVGVAGTMTTIAAMALRLTAYLSTEIHRSWLPRERVLDVVDELAAMTVAERRRLGFMAPGRADVIAGGGLVVAGVLRRLDLPGLLVSESDILDGIAWSQL